MNKQSSPGFMERLATAIVDRRGLIILLFVAACLFCVVSNGWVKVTDDLTAFLPEETETRQGLDLMESEFTTYATAKVMVANISLEQARELAERLEAIPHVKSVGFDDTAAHYASASALFSLSFDGGVDAPGSVEALNAVRGLLSPYDLYIDTEVGNPLKAVIDREMLVVDLIACVIIVLVLLLTSRTYGEIPVLLLTFGAAALLNMGTNYLMGEISFVTDSIAIVLQLALGIDYAIILCHRFMEEREKAEPRAAAIKALSKAIPEISASSLTTVAGLLALCFMQYRLGYDMGTVLIKAILLSLCSVFLLMPGLLILFSGLIDKTKHRSFVPKIDFLGKLAYATRFVMPVLFLGVFVAATFFSSKVNYVYSQYSVSSIRHNEEQVAKARIEELFGRVNQMALLVPAGDDDRELGLIREIEQLSHVEKVTGLASIEAMDGYTLTDRLTPRAFAELLNLDNEVARTLYASYAMNRSDYGQVVTNLSNYSVPLIDMLDFLLDWRSEVTLNMSEETEKRLDELKDELDTARVQLRGEHWSRIVIELDLPEEGEESYAYLEIIAGVTARYYDEFHLVGSTTSCSDLRRSFEHDNMLISILTILFVIAVLLLTFQSAGLPLLLILIIQGSIFCNFSVPTLRHSNLFFLSYLIISAIQMGANIDYAIVISSRYMELKKTRPLRQAIIETLNLSFPTIITSGTMLASAGVTIGLVASNETISSIGIYLGMGTFISIFLVMCVLPQILLMGDSLIRKTSFTIDPNLKLASRAGLMRIDGRVRGNLNGFVDAEIHGVFRGEMTAMVDMKNITECEGYQLEEHLEDETCTDRT